MPDIHIPKDYNRVMPYLILEKPEQFLAFTQDVFGAVEKMKVMRDEKNIMHAEMLIGESCIMFAASTDQFGVQNSGLYINVVDADATYQKALAEGATSIMEPSDQEYGRSGGIKDPCGNIWWITTSPK